VVNSYAATSEWVPVSKLNSVLFPTDGKPMNPTLATPVRATSNPASEYQSRSSRAERRREVEVLPPPPPLEGGATSSFRSLASFAFN
jgi:hypothetical protein